MCNNNDDGDTAASKQTILLQPKFIYGLRNDVKSNTHFTNGNDIVYTAAGFLVQHNFIEKKQRFLAFNETNVPCLIATNPSRTNLAILEFNEAKKKCVRDFIVNLINFSYIYFVC